MGSEARDANVFSGGIADEALAPHRRRAARMPPPEYLIRFSDSALCLVMGLSKARGESRSLRIERAPSRDYGRNYFRARV